MSPESTLVPRLLKLFPGRNKLNHGQIAHVALALRLFRRRALFDDFARAMANGSVSIRLQELLWVAISQDLLARGYVIPSRYSLSPPHQKAPATHANRNPVTDWRTLPAFCLSSRSQVVLKIASIEESFESKEIEIYRLLTSTPYVNDPRNPIVTDTRIVTLRDNEDEAFVTLLVMPLLAPVRSDRFHTHAARFEFARQIINGLAYLHELGICHGDIDLSNLLMSHSGPPFKIYFIDFDLARRETDRTRMVAWEGGKIRLPELGADLSQPKLYHPFQADIYSLGVTWFHFESTLPFRRMTELRRHMCELDASVRPTAEECTIAYGQIYATIPRSLLYSASADFGLLWRITRGNRMFWARELGLYLRELSVLVSRGVECKI